MKRATLMGTLMSIGLAWPIFAGALESQLKVLKEYKSLYRNVTVVESSNRRCVRLLNKKNPYNSQSCLLLNDHKQLLFFYSQAMLAALTTQSDGFKVLSVGLGGGTMPNAIRDYFPNADITTVELDPKMLLAAQEFMYFKEDDKNTVVVQDARYFIRKEKVRKAQYDVVLLDAFNGEYIPEHLTTQEFLQEVKAILKPEGMVLSNTFSHKDFFHSESVTYDSVFPGFCAFSAAGVRTIVAYKDSACQLEPIAASITKHADRLKPYIPRPLSFVRLLSNDKNWDKEARIFTDQFSPANIYNVD